jgi:hypothetical protein
LATSGTALSVEDRDQVFRVLQKTEDLPLRDLSQIPLGFSYWWNQKLDFELKDLKEEVKHQ